MPTFPALNARGLLVQRPYSRSYAALTSAEEQPSGRRYARAWRPEPLARYTLQYPSLTDAEYGVLRTFFNARGGRYESFGWIDPAGNLCRYSEDFAQAAWTKSAVSVGPSVTDPFGGSRATSVTGSSGAAYLQIDIEPTPLNGRVLCASAWLRSAAGGVTCSVGFADGGNFYTERVLPAGVWIRIEHTRTITSTGTIGVLIGVGAATVEVFGAQCVATPGAGAYARSPLMYAWRPNCRFGSDVLDATEQGPDHWTCAIDIEEFFAPDA